MLLPAICVCINDEFYLANASNYKYDYVYFGVSSQQHLSSLNFVVPCWG